MAVFTATGATEFRTRLRRVRLGVGVFMAVLPGDGALGDVHRGDLVPVPFQPARPAPGTVVAAGTGELRIAAGARGAGAPGGNLNDFQARPGSEVGGGIHGLAACGLGDPVVVLAPDAAGFQGG